MAELCTLSGIIPFSNCGSLFDTLDDVSCSECVFCIAVELQQVSEPLSVLIVSNCCFNSSWLHLDMFVYVSSLFGKAVAGTVQASL